MVLLSIGSFLYDILQTLLALIQYVLHFFETLFVLLSTIPQYTAFILSVTTWLPGSLLAIALVYVSLRVCFRLLKYD